MNRLDRDRNIEKKRTSITILIYVVCFILLGSFITIHYTSSRFAKSTEVTYDSDLKDFDIDFELKYMDAGVERTITPADLSASHGIIRLTVPQYETLTLNTIYSGEGKCYYRFKVYESWLHKTDTNEDAITPRSLSDYSLTEDFYDNRSDDGWIYYKEAIAGDSPTDEIVISAISNCIPGIDAPDLLSDDDRSTMVDIAVEVEGVQWNRVKELWNISKLPWE